MHEHACLRCGLLRPDPAQIDRLRDIVANLADCIDEAEQHNWLGEVEALKVSHAAALVKLEQMNRQTAAAPVNLGLPGILTAASPAHPHRQCDEGSVDLGATISL